MKLKNINNYELHKNNAKIILNYRKFLKNRKLNKIVKLELYKKFKATLILLELYLEGSDKFKKNKIKKLAQVFKTYNYDLRIKNKTLLIVLKNTFTLISKSLPILSNNIYGPGFIEPSFLKRQFNFLNYNIFLSKISKFKFLNVEQNKRKFINMLKKNQINKIDIINILPSFFFSDSIKDLKNFNINFNAASDLIFNDNIGKLFISSANFKFINWAHGGAYYEYKNSYLENFEKNLAGKYPKIQKTFGKNLKFDAKNTELILALRSPPIRIDKFINPYLYEHLNDKENFNIFKSLIEKYEIKIRAHPRGLNKVYKNYRFKNFTKKINNNSIILFDTMSSSLVNWCLAKKIPFIYIIKNLKFKNLHPRFVRYIKTSEVNNCLLFYKNRKSTEIFFEKLLSNKLNINKIIKTNKKIFNDIKLYDE